MSRFARRNRSAVVSSRSETPFSNLIYRALIPVLLGVGLFLILSQTTGCSTDPDPEVWVIGLDGADWDQLDPMIARGELPHLAALKTEGASGVLRSEKPLISPVLWTTIATGKSPDQHGVTWFMTEGANGEKIPVSSNQRQARSFWNIASEAGLNSGVVGWWATWPADPINGFVISDYVGWHSFGVSGRNEQDTGKTWPTELISTVRELMPDPTEIPASQLTDLIHLPTSRLAHDPASDPYSDPIAHLRQAMATSRGYTDVVLDRLDSGRDERPALLAVYYEGTDAVTHLFGDYQAPRLPWINQDDFAAYCDVVNQYWRWQDQLLGELLARRGPNTTVVIVSDHGFRVGSERRKEDAFHIETADADHMFDGVVVVSGPGVEPGAHLSDADIYDIAPTVLYALDLPVAADMPGRVLTDALAAGVVASAPVRSVVTYETSPILRQENVARPEGASEDLEKMLRSLGYISGTSTAGSTAKGPGPEEVVNMATVLMHQGRFDEAITSLRDAAALNPEIMEVQLNLAQALARSGQADQVIEGEDLYRDLLTTYPDQLVIHEDLTTVLLNAGRNAEALQIFALGLQQDPRWVNGLAGKGQAQFGLGRTTEAESTLQAALRENPRHIHANLALGQLLVKTGRTQAGLPRLETAHHLDPADPVAALRLASVQQQQGQMAGSLQTLQSCLNNNRPRADLLAEKGAVLLRMGRTAEAFAPLQQAVKLDPENTMILGNLGMAFALNNELPAAVSTFEKVVALEPEMAAGHAQLGALYAQSGQMIQAEDSMQTAVAKDPQNTGLLVNLGRVQVLNDHKQEARGAFKEALRIDPDMVPALYQLGNLEKGLGNTQEANRLLQKAHFIETDGRSAP